jgi:hypothetical protein
VVVNELIWVYRGLGKQVSGPATASSSPSQRAGLFLARRFLRAGRPRTYRMTPASSKFPTSYWNKLIPLAEISLNCLLPWQPNPAISAYHGLTGAPFDFRAHPVSPAGTSILIHEAWYIGRAWCVPGYYLVGPALTHYRFYQYVYDNTVDWISLYY